MAGLGQLSVDEYSIGGVDVFEVSGCEGVDSAYYPQHIITLFRRPYQMVGNWEGQRLSVPWENGKTLFIPMGSVLSFRAESPYDETVIRLRQDLFQLACRDHIDFNSIDFTFRDVTSVATWHLGTALGGMVASDEYRCWPLLVESAAMSLVVAVIRGLSPGASTAFSPITYGLSDRRLSKVVGYIDDRIKHHITLAELAGVANLSIFHFCRSFRNRMGLTPSQYMAKRRVMVAKGLLRSTMDSLVSVSMACGFSNQSHFTTVFRKIVGVTPAEYRRSGE